MRENWEYIKRKVTPKCNLSHGPPEGIWTPSRQNRNLMHYPIMLRAEMLIYQCFLPILWHSFCKLTYKKTYFSFRLTLWRFRRFGFLTPPLYLYKLSLSRPGRNVAAFLIQAKCRASVDKENWRRCDVWYAIRILHVLWCELLFFPSHFYPWPS